MLGAGFRGPWALSPKDSPAIKSVGYTLSMRRTRALASVFIAIVLMPLVVSAQTTPAPGGSNAQLLAALEQLVVELQSELQLLLAQSAGTAPQQSPTTSVSAPIGAAPAYEAPPSSSIGTPTCTLSLDNPLVYAGASATLSWTSTNATTGTITPGVGVVSPSGSQLMADLTQSTTWTGAFTGAGGTAACVASVTVVAATGGGATFGASPTSGSAPLIVAFSGGGAGDSVSFGDGSSPQTLSATACTNSVPPSCAYGVTHTYTADGLYTVLLENSSGASIGVETILVTGGTPTTGPAGGNAPAACPVYTFQLCTSGTYIAQQIQPNGCSIPAHTVCSTNTTPPIGSQNTPSNPVSGYGAIGGAPPSEPLY